jgi:cyclopropane fatty-acyl-phospholipid synthase-like methyltransferase
MRREVIHVAVADYYSGKFAEHGASARGVDWSSEESQELRFEQLAQLLRHEEDGFTVNDLGCGYGAFAAFLARHGFDAEYTGYELSEAMLAHARKAFGGEEKVRFEEGAVLGAADYSVASGIFNVRLGFGDREWGTYVDETIEELATSSGKGFAFNMLTSYSDAEYRREDLYYADPTAVFDMCKRRYSRDVALLHDYGLFEFTIIVRKQ